MSPGMLADLPGSSPHVRYV